MAIRVPRHLPVMAAALLLGCTQVVYTSLVSPQDMHTLDRDVPVLKAHLADGGLFVLSYWQVDSTTSGISGNGVRYDAYRRQVESGPMALPLDSVVLFETNSVESSPSNKAITAFFGVTALVAGICIADPKACFGSCPTFYAPGANGEPRLQAEGFSSSIAPGLEATDIDHLVHSRPQGREYQVRVTNEAFETHVIRRADLLAVPRGRHGHAHLSSGGSFVSTGPSIEPRSCRAAEGSCLAELAELDGVERWSSADSVDLATREVIDLEFPAVEAATYGLVISSRQTLMTTFLLYQGLAYLGEEAGRFVAQMGRSDGHEGSGGADFGSLLGSIDVQVMGSDGAWRTVGSAGETGPIASDTRVIPLGEVTGEPSVRLSLTRGMWRIDRVALVEVGETVEPIRLEPRQVFRDGVLDTEALAALTDPARTLVTLPGDAYDLVYQLPPVPGDHELFMEATGYYLEWMRQEWIEEQDPAKAAQFVLDPAGVLRALAPAFKRYEAHADSLFWNSRYVR